MGEVVRDSGLGKTWAQKKMGARAGRDLHGGDLGRMRMRDGTCCVRDCHVMRGREPVMGRDSRDVG
jgi:hypothetical protein